MVHLKLQLTLFLLISIKQLSAIPQKSHGGRNKSCGPEGEASVCGAVKVVLSQDNDFRFLMLTVYYESKCPDSKSFILKQLVPTMQQLHEFITLKFVPFGKSRSINYGDGGFECQHGPAECLGNVVQDCSLHFLNEKSDREKLAYVACEMDTTAGSQGKFDCVEKANLSKAEVEDCVVSGKGTVLQLESEYYTNLVKPKFVPTVTVNGIFDQEFQDKAQNDLFGACCSLIPEAAPCAQYYNYLALNHLMYEPVYVQ